MPLLNKLPNVGDRAIVLLSRARGRNVSRGWTAATGGGGEYNVDLALAEVLCNSKSHGNIRREDRHYDGISFTFYDPEFHEVDRKFILNTVYYASDYMSMAAQQITMQTLEPEAKEFLAGFLYPQPVVDGSYAKLVQDVRGDTNIPTSATALIETVKEQATALGIRWMPLPEHQPHADITQIIRDRLEGDYETLLNNIRGVVSVPQPWDGGFTAPDEPEQDDPDEEDDE